MSGGDPNTAGCLLTAEPLNRWPARTANTLHNLSQRRTVIGVDNAGHYSQFPQTITAKRGSAVWLENYE